MFEEPIPFLIVGSGLAGLNAALMLAEYGRVCVVTKRADDAASAWAQGGIASVLPDSNDTLEAHIRDTLEAGAGLCNVEAVRSIVEAGPEAVARLVSLGVHFDQNAAGYHRTREGGHSAHRILHAGDVTGREIMRALWERARAHANITLLDSHIAVDLLTLKKQGIADDDRCVGAYVLDCIEGRVEAVRAHTTLLATGGAGKAYLYTSNPDSATGDGIAMAFRAGAHIANMEFFQFHPTCLYHPQAKSFLISEALRGEGGILRRADGTALMDGLHPLKDLAPRDVVARAIDADMKRSGADCVFLDMTGEDPDHVRTRFPSIYARCLDFGIDITKHQIPVVPAAHYLCGGVVTNLEAETTLPGLWAAGETAHTGLHGANRLASNSLLEAVVMSSRAADGMKHAIQHDDALPAVHPWDEGQAVDADELVVVAHNWDELRRTMWNYVGIVRSDRRLTRAASRLGLLYREIQEYYWNFRLTLDLVELRNLCDVARLVVASARHRRESRGLHTNRDTPDLLPGTPQDTVVSWTAEGLRFHPRMGAPTGV